MTLSDESRPPAPEIQPPPSDWKTNRPDDQGGGIWRQVGCAALIVGLLIAILALFVYLQIPKDGGATPPPSTPAVTATPLAPTQTPLVSAPATQRLVTPTRRPPTPSTPVPAETGASNPGQTISAPVRAP